MKIGHVDRYCSYHVAVKVDVAEVQSDQYIIFMLCSSSTADSRGELQLQSGVSGGRDPSDKSTLDFHLEIATRQCAVPCVNPPRRNV